MALFAELDAAGVVLQVLVVESLDLCTRAYPGRTFVETFMNHPTERYAFVGGRFHPDHPRRFSTRPPFASWELDDNLDWRPPLAPPAVDRTRETLTWDETARRWQVLPLTAGQGRTDT